MSGYRTLAALQHAMQHPSGHLDRWAQFGPAFEMPEAGRAETHSAEYHAHAQQVNPDDTPQATATAPAPVPATFDAKQFITAGKAIFTLEGVQARYTYRVNCVEPKADSPYTSVAYFVSLLTGPDNLSDYTYVGMLNVQTGQVRLTAKSRYTTDSQPVKALNWALARIWRGVGIEPATLYHAGRCGRCGRVLTVPSSIESGFGPECSGKLGS